MKKRIIIKNNLFIISTILILLLYAIFYYYFKYSPTEWLKHFSNTDELNKVSNYSFWWFILSGEIFGSFVYIFPIILVMISASEFFEIYHTGFFLNIIQRIGYKKTIVTEMLKAYKYSLFLPFVSILTLLMSKILYKNNIIYKYEDTKGYPIQLVNELMEKIDPKLFILIHSILLIIFSLIIINIGLIFSKFFKKFYLVNITSFITLLFIENFNNLLLAPIIAKITGIEKMYNGFSIYNLYYLNAYPSIIWEFIFGIFLLILSTIIVYFIYRKKEEICLNYE